MIASINRLYWNTKLENKENRNCDGTGGTTSQTISAFVRITAVTRSLCAKEPVK